MVLQRKLILPTSIHWIQWFLPVGSIGFRWVQLENPMVPLECSNGSNGTQLLQSTFWASKIIQINTNISHTVLVLKFRQFASHCICHIFRAIELFSYFLINIGAQETGQIYITRSCISRKRICTRWWIMQPDHCVQLSLIKFIYYSTNSFSIRNSLNSLMVIVPPPSLS